MADIPEPTETEWNAFDAAISDIMSDGFVLEPVDPDDVREREIRTAVILHGEEMKIDVFIDWNRTTRRMEIFMRIGAYIGDLKEKKSGQEKIFHDFDVDSPMDMIRPEHREGFAKGAFACELNRLSRKLNGGRGNAKKIQAKMQRLQRDYAMLMIDLFMKKLSEPNDHKEPPRTMEKKPAVLLESPYDRPQ